MTDNQKALKTQSNGDWRPQTMAIGGLIGAALGLLSAFLYIRASEERHGGKPPEAPTTGDSVRLGISLLGIVRTIAEWGQK